MPLDKQVISRNFSRFAKSYEHSARLQKRVAEELVAQCEGFKGRVLDLGAGPGIIGKISGWDVTPVDISLEMCRAADGAVNADIEHLPFMDESFNNAIASLSMQWVDMEKALPEIFRVLKPGGRFAFSTFTPNNLKDLVAAFSYLDSDQHLMEYEHAIKIFAMLKKAGFSDVIMNSQIISYVYPNMIDALRSIKNIGASYNFAGNVKPKTRGYFRKLENAYKAITKVDDGVVLSWEMFYVTARKSF